MPKWKRHDFRTSLKLGQQHEDVFLQAHPHLTRSPVRSYDFVTLKGEYVELKTDLYDPRQTVNFFFERYSDSEKQKPGGVWQALGNGANYFIYYYPKTGEYYTFQTRELCAVLNVIERHCKQVRVLNHAWITTGFLVKREDLEPIMSKFNLRKGNKWKT